MDTLPLIKAGDLPEADLEADWLIEPLWAFQAVGLIGGEPKCCKSFLALQLALSVATGAPCLGRFAVRHTGPVLFYAAEDALSAIRARLSGLCRRARVTLDSIELYFVSVPSLRLDRQDDCVRLARTVERLRPALVVLDPFVRLHRKDENVSAEIVPLLAILRELQRRYRCAVALVHHAKKGASHLRTGQALRGSSEFHAWSDSGLYLRRCSERLHLTVEHRAQPAPQPLWLRLETSDQGTVLVLDDRAPGESTPERPERAPEARVLAALRTAARPLRVRELRETCRLRTATLCAILPAMVEAGSIQKTDDGYLLPEAVPGKSTAAAFPSPPPQQSTDTPASTSLSAAPLPEPAIDPRQVRFPFLAAE